MSVPGGAEEGPPPQRNKPTESKERNARYRYRAASYSVCLYIIVRYCAEYGTPRCGIPGLASAVPCRTVHAVRRNFGRWICAGVDLFLPLCREPFVSVIHAGIGQATTKEGKARQGKAIQVTTNTIYPMHAYIRTPLQMKYTFPCHKKYGMYCTALHCIGLRCVARKLPRWGREKIEQTNTTHFAGKFEARNTTKPWPRSAASWRRSFIHYFGSVRFSHPLCFSTSYCM